jgi:hypothetical protein
MRAIFESLPGLIDEIQNDEAREAIVFAVWPTVLGTHLRDRATPLSFENAILSVAVSDAEWKREFKEQASQIVFKLNRTFGRSMVERIELKMDRKAVVGSNRKTENDIVADGRQQLVSKDLAHASKTIADPELRSHFLEAAAACIELRDAK